MLKFDLNIQNNFGRYSDIPVSNTIKKILIGKLFNWHNSNTFVILGVRRNNLYGYLEVLAGNIPVSKKYGMSKSINVYSWYAFQPKNMYFIGRDSKQAIRNCLKTNPKYIKHHIGKSVNINDFIIYDNCNYYEDHKKSVNF
jgi:hypothetical protein